MYTSERSRTYNLNANMDVDREFDTDEFFQALSSGNNTSTIDTDDTDHDPWNEVRRKRNKKKSSKYNVHK
jgi:hypothetical protein